MIPYQEDDVVSLEIMRDGLSTYYFEGDGKYEWEWEYDVVLTAKEATLLNEGEEFIRYEW